MLQESLGWSEGEGEGNRLVFERLELLLVCLVGVVFLPEFNNGTPRADFRLAD